MTDDDLFPPGEGATLSFARFHLCGGDGETFGELWSKKIQAEIHAPGGPFDYVEDKPPPFTEIDRIRFISAADSCRRRILNDLRRGYLRACGFPPAGLEPQAIHRLWWAQEPISVDFEKGTVEANGITFHTVLVYRPRVPKRAPLVPSTTPEPLRAPVSENIQRARDWVLAEFAKNPRYKLEQLYPDCRKATGASTREIGAALKLVPDRPTRGRPRGGR